MSTKTIAKNLLRKDPANPWGVVYMAGGNPPISAGIFNQDGVRLAWWPAGAPVTDETLDLVLTELIWKREDDKPVSRNAIRDLMKQIGENHEATA